MVACGPQSHCYVRYLMLCIHGISDDIFGSAGAALLSLRRDARGAANRTYLPPLEEEAVWASFPGTGSSSVPAILVMGSLRSWFSGTNPRRIKVEKGSEKLQDVAHSPPPQLPQGKYEVRILP